jgi:phosphoglucomutase
MTKLIGVKDRFDIAFGNDPDADWHGIVTRIAVNEAQGITVHFGFELGEIKTVPGLPRAEVSPKGAMVGI